MATAVPNLESETVAGFGDEWSRFDQRGVSAEEMSALFARYFSIFPWNSLPADAVGFDLGCGSGRWARFVAPRVGKIHCVDASAEALAVARRNLRDFPQCEFHHASVDAIPVPDGSMDFGYSLGVLHHVPDTVAAIRSCTAKLKPGAPFLVYLYYAFDNRPPWFRAIWRASELGRAVISRMPMSARYLSSQALAVSIYYPLARAALLVEKLGVSVDRWPLAAYRASSLYVMRNDALDRFGTRLEQRFSADAIREMLEVADLEHVRISDGVPYWCAVGTKRAAS